MENLIVIWQIAQHKMYNQYHLVTLLYMVHHCSTSCGLSICIVDKPNIILFLLRLNLSWTGKWIRFWLWLSGESVRFFWSASYIRVFQEVTSSGTKWQKRVSCTTGSLCDTGLKTALPNTTNHRAPHLNSLSLSLFCAHIASQRVFLQCACQLHAAFYVFLCVFVSFYFLLIQTTFWRDS